MLALGVVLVSASLFTVQPVGAQSYVGTTVQPLPFGDAATVGQVLLTAQG